MVIVAACIAANLPFVNQRLLAAGPALASHKSLWLRLLELVVLYFVVGTFALLLEQRAGDGVELPALGGNLPGTLFVTLAFPGFVYRYLVRHRGA